MLEVGFEPIASWTVTPSQRLGPHGPYVDQEDP